MSVQIDIQQKNTAAWRREVLDLQFPEFPCSPPEETENATLALLPGNIAMFPEFDFSIALLAGFHRSGVYCIIPVSPYSAPATEFEIRLPDSAFVLQTWNTRFMSRNDIKKIIPVERLSSADFTIALKHHRFCFDAEPFVSELTGQKMSLFSPDDDVLNSYLLKQYEMYPDEFFTVIENVPVAMDEYSDADEDKNANCYDRNILFPGSSDWSLNSCEENKAASKHVPPIDLDDLF